MGATSVDVYFSVVILRSVSRIQYLATIALAELTPLTYVWIHSHTIPRPGE